MERICEVAEEAVRGYIASRVPSRGISNLTITVDLKGTQTLTVDVDVEVTLSPLLRSLNVEELVNKAVKAAFEAVERYLRENGCQYKV